MKVELIYLFVSQPGYPSAPPPSYYLPFSKRWAQTYRQFDAGYKHEVSIVTCGDLPDAEATRTFGGVPHRWMTYTGAGSDIGAHQWAMKHSGADLVVCMSTPIYFHRDFWLRRLVEAREHFGDGLYGAMASKQNSPHMRTSFWAVNPKTFARYPHTIDTREKACWAESQGEGDWQISRWFGMQGLPQLMVTWDQVVDLEHCREPENVFRKGDQSNCIVRDQHWDYFAACHYREKLDLEIAANGL